MDANSQCRNGVLYVVMAWQSASKWSDLGIIDHQIETEIALIDVDVVGVNGGGRLFAILNHLDVGRGGDVERFVDEQSGGNEVCEIHKCLGECFRGAVNIEVVRVDGGDDGQIGIQTMKAAIEFVGLKHYDFAFAGEIDAVCFADVVGAKVGGYATQKCGEIHVATMQ